MSTDQTAPIWARRETEGAERNAPLDIIFAGGVLGAVQVNQATDAGTLDGQALAARERWRRKLRSTVMKRCGAMQPGAML